jgi:hypothetical protein
MCLAGGVVKGRKREEMSRHNCLKGRKLRMCEGNKGRRVEKINFGDFFEIFLPKKKSGIKPGVGYMLTFSKIFPLKNTYF